MKKKAFTLIELLVVIVIIGILATIGVAQFNEYQERARMARAQVFASQSQRLLNLSLEKTVGNWNFNQVSGSIIPDMTGKNDLPLNNATIVDESFHTGGQSALKTNSQSIQLSTQKTNQISDAFTMSSWIKLDIAATTLSAAIIVSPFDLGTSYDAGVSYTPSMGYWNDGSNLQIRTGRWHTTPFNITDGKWYHHLLTMRRTGDETCEFKTYLDGVLANHVASYFCPNDNVDVDNVHIGANQTIDDLNVWNEWYEGS
jgi:prepilin-type N-terminal cleavage/methylation domain-containing protein